MDNFGGGSFAIKNQLMRNFETGNVIIDLLIGSILCTAITTLFRVVDLYKLGENIKKLLCYNNRYKSSIFLEYSKTGLTDSFKGIL